MDCGGTGVDRIVVCGSMDCGGFGVDRVVGCGGTGVDQECGLCWH